VIKGQIESQDSVYTYELNVTKEELIESHVKDWTLQWCAKYHPEVLEKARNFIKESLDENKEKIKECNV